MLQKLQVNGFKQLIDLSELDDGFIKSYNEKNKKEYFLAEDFQYLENLQNVQNDLLFLPERMAIEKVEKHVANLHDKNEYGIHMKNSKQALITEYI